MPSRFARSVVHSSWLGALAGHAITAALGCAVDTREVSSQPLTPFTGAGGATAQPSGAPGSTQQAPATNTGGTGATAASNPATSAPIPPLGGAATPADAGAVNVAAAGGLVSGRVLDFFRRPVPNVSVRIGDVSVTSDAQGGFSIPNVSAPYSVSLLVNTLHYERATRYGYLYQGLTRSDPTLQVYAALPEHTTELTITVPNIDFSVPGQLVSCAFSTPDERLTAVVDSIAQTLTMPWTGPATTLGTAHALLFLNGAASGVIPSAYQAQQGSTLAVSDGTALLPLDLSATTSLAAANLSGNVSSGTQTSRKNFVALRFTDGTALPVVEDDDATGAFSYLVPSIAGASLLVVAAEGRGVPEAYSVVHRENLAPGQTGVALSIPNPVSLSSPGSDASASLGSSFSWSNLGQSASSFVWHLRFRDTQDEMFVITAQTSIALPDFADGSTWTPGALAEWSVQTHGDVVGVDALAGPDGFMDAFSYSTSSDEGASAGPNHSDGYFTESAVRPVTLQ